MCWAMVTSMSGVFSLIPKISERIDMSSIEHRIIRREIHLQKGALVDIVDTGQ